MKIEDALLEIAEEMGRGLPLQEAVARARKVAMKADAYLKERGRSRTPALQALFDWIARYQAN